MKYNHLTAEQRVYVETIYAYILAYKQNGGDLWKHCRHQLKHRKRQVSSSYTAVQNRTVIDQRPQEWDGTTPGDFEMDTIVGKVGKGTIVERSMNFTLARKLPEGKKAKALAQAVILMLLPYIGKIRSITTDNGSEFAEHLLISKHLKTKIFFATHIRHGKKDALNITINSLDNTFKRAQTVIQFLMKC